MTGVCPDCGRPLDLHDRHVRFTLPDPVLDLPERDRTPDTWMDASDARASVFLVVPSLGGFVRCLLPARLTGGYTVTFGVWVWVTKPDFERIVARWHAPEYVDLAFDGVLANAVPPWGGLGAPVSTEVREADFTPYCATSTDPALQGVLADVWPHEPVLAAIEGR